MNGGGTLTGLLSQGHGQRLVFGKMTDEFNFQAETRVPMAATISHPAHCSCSPLATEKAEDGQRCGRSVPRNFSEVKSQRVPCYNGQITKHK
ncbi:hypothetical protein CEXT_618881 [Caerostris extrusa]|uniref:Uncharacterized protein n=1 Tax=Caerostris extrusa TaxID=172846 RepID=A0AAV4S7L1_CAEEX|nr:hypothetical protein CEXT_618881 [Caerostris extrusa]